MKYKDRADILEQLKDAFVPDNTVKESRVTTEVVRMDGHNVARVTNITQVSQGEEIYAKYPKSYVVKNLIGILKTVNMVDAVKACDKLEHTLFALAHKPDELDELLRICTECEQRIYGSPIGSTQREMVYYYIIDRILKL